MGYPEGPAKLDDAQTTQEQTYLRTPRLRLKAMRPPRTSPIIILLLLITETRLFRPNHILVSVSTQLAL